MRFCFLEEYGHLGWQRSGVAYERDGRALLFILGSRAPKILERYMDALNEQDYPAGGKAYRWGEVRMGRDDADPIDLLKG